MISVAKIPGFVGGIVTKDESAGALRWLFGEALKPLSSISLLISFLRLLIDEEGTFTMFVVR